MRLFRKNLIQEMRKDQAELRQAEIPEDEILHHLVERYHPTNVELRATRHPLAEFIRSPENEKMLLSEILYREEKRQFNRSQRLNQIIAVVRTPWETVHGEKRIVYLLHLVAGDKTEGPLRRVQKVIDALENKKKSLIDKAGHEKQYRETARKTERSIERRRGSSGKRSP
jgi:hypothetical protein